MVNNLVSLVYLPNEENLTHWLTLNLTEGNKSQGAPQ